MITGSIRRRPGRLVVAVGAAVVLLTAGLVLLLVPGGADVTAPRPTTAEAATETARLLLDARTSGDGATLWAGLDAAGQERYSAATVDSLLGDAPADYQFAGVRLVSEHKAELTYVLITDVKRERRVTVLRHDGTRWRWELPPTGTL